MRKIIIIVVSLLVPFGLWTAGCRQNNRQASFPNSPEMKSLARAPEQDSPTRAPVISAAPIDRDIMNLPEQPTMAKINAVNDKSNMMAGPRGNPGLFVLPDEGQNHMASAGGRNEGMAPIPSGREFWSKPASMPANSRSMDAAPQGISAMMPAAPAQGYSASYASPYPSSPAPYTPPAPASYAPSVPYEVPMQGGALMLPEDIPGVFMDTDLGPFSMAPGQPPTRYASPVYSAQSGFSGTAEFLDYTGDARSAPPALSSGGFESVPIENPGSAMRENEPAATNGAVKLDLAGLLGSMRDITDTLIPAGEPAAQLMPPPLPAMEPVTAGAGSPLPLPILDSPARNKASAFDAGDMRQALAPLPDMTAMASSPSPVVREAPRISMPPPMPEPMPPPEMVAAKAVLLDYTPPAREGEKAPTALGADEFFRSENWGLKMPELTDLPVMQSPMPSAAPSVQAAKRPDLPELEFETVSTPVPASARQNIQPDAPQKVKLEPMRTSRIRQAELQEIDASASVPPLRF